MWKLVVAGVLVAAGSALLVGLAAVAAAGVADEREADGWWSE